MRKREVVKKAISLFFVLAILLSIFPTAALAVEESTEETPAEQTATLAGSGTESDPYQIGTAAELVYAAEQMNADSSQAGYAKAYYVLTANIDMQGVTYTPVDYFSGVLDGKNHTISNLEIRDTKTGSIGDYQIAFIRRNAGTIENLVFEKAYVSSTASDNSGYAATAVIAGENRKGGVISGCSVLNSEVYAPGVPKVAGIAGMSGRDGNNAATITGCVFQGKLTCGPRTGSWGPMAGGIVAQNHTSTLEYCVADAEIIIEGSSANPRVGIICGYERASTLRSNVAMGGSITYDATSETSGYSRAGRIYGDAVSTKELTNQIANRAITVNGAVVSSSEKNGTDVTADELKKVSTWELYGWDMESSWKLGENGYPVHLEEGETPPIRLSGEGTSANPYQISNESDLTYMVGRLNQNDERVEGKYFILTNDITLTKEFTMIESFSGVLDGDGHTIKNMVIHDTNTASVTQYRLGFVRSLSGTIQNLIFDQPTVTSTADSGNDGYSGAGIIVGLMEKDSLVSGCRVIDGTVNVPKLSKVGGIACMVGYDGQWSATISCCVFTGTLNCGPRSGSYGPMAGGIAAYAGTGVIEYCVSSAAINIPDESSAACVGGICGYTNKVTFKSDVVWGGAINVNSAVKNLYAARIAGRAPYKNNTYANNLALDSYAINDTAVSTEGAEQGTSMTAEQLKQQSTYETIGYNFTLQWTMAEEGYPVPKVFSYSSSTVNSIAATPSADASTEMSFSWQYAANADGVVQLSTSKAMTNCVEFAAENSGTQYRAHATGLTADTTYFYRVGSKANQAFSEVASFTTAPENGAFSFISLSDADASDVSSMTLAEETLEAAQLVVLDSSFVLHGGDMTGGGTKDWQYFFSLHQKLLNSTPIAPAAGEYDAGGFTSYFNVGDKGYYSFDYSNAHFAVLNTNEDSTACISDEQLEWLRNDVTQARENGAEWIILSMHKGTYTSGIHAQDDEIKDLRSVLLPVIDELDIDLVIQGHDHILGRTYVLNGGKITGKTDYTEVVNGNRFEYSVDPDGTIYMTPGTCGREISQQISMTTEELEDYIALFARSDQRAGTTAGSVQTFAGVTVDGGRLSVAVYEIKKSMNPTMIEGFGIDKEVTAVNTLISSGNLTEARKAYNALSDAQQKQITNYSALVSAESGITTGNAGKWLDASASERRAVTVRNDTDLEFTDVPVRVQIENAPSSVIKFYAATGEELPCEVESYQESGTSTVWVRVPTIAADTVTSLWVYFGGKASSYAVKDVWNDDYSLVEHFAVSANNGAKITDSTGKQTGTVTGSVQAVEADGEMAAEFSNSKITYGSIGDDYDFISVSAVVSVTAEDLNGQDEAIVSKYYPGDPSGENTYLLGISEKNQLRSYYGCMWWRSNKEEKHTYLNNLPADGKAHLITVTYDGFTVVTYVDGEPVSEDTVFIESASFLNPDLPTVIGAYSDEDTAALTGAFQGTLYEVEITGQRTTAQWEKFRAENYLGDVVSVGAAEKNGSSSLSLSADSAGKDAPCKTGCQTVNGIISQDAELTAVVGGETYNLGMVQAGTFQVEVPVTKTGEQKLTLTASSASSTASVAITFVAEDTEAPATPVLTSETVSNGLQLKAQVEALQGEKNTVQFYTDESIRLTESNLAVFEGGTDAYTPDGIDPLSVNYTASSGTVTSTKTDEAPYQIYRIALDEAQRADTSYHLTWQGESERQVHAYAYDLTENKWVSVGKTSGTGQISIDTQIEGEQYVSVDGYLYVLFFRGLGCNLSDMTSFVPEEGQYDFTMFWNSDTQYMSQFYPESFLHQYQWIADNYKEKKGIITFNTGDITNRSNLNYEYNWRVADEGYDILEENNIPYTIVLGNHDYRYDGKPNEDRLKDEYFPVSRINGEISGSGWEVTTSGDVNNICMKGEFSGVKLMLLSVSYYMQQSDIDWAEQQVKNNPDYNVFILTHTFNAKGKFTGNATFRTQVVEKYDNIKLVFCGHIDGADLIRPYEGREFYGVLEDYQGEDTDLLYGGEEFLRMVQFDLENDLVYFNTYSPLTGGTLSLYGVGKYQETEGLYQKNKDEFVIQLDLGGSTERSFSTTGLTLAAGNAKLVETKTTNGSATVETTASGLAQNTTYEWYVVVTDEAGNTTRSLPEQFTTEESSGGDPEPEPKPDPEPTPDPTPDPYPSEQNTYYNIILKSTENGNVSADHKTAAAGQTVTLTVTPKSGYQLSELSVKDSKKDNVALTYRENGKYTFIMPECAVSVSAKFAAEQKVVQAEFQDVPESAYYYEAVNWAVEKEITSGATATAFAPEAACTRAQMMTFLWRAAGSPAPESATCVFTDVSSGAYYYNAILWAVENGVTMGTSDTTFSPDQTVTRAQTVTFLWRMAGSPAASGSHFADVTANAYYATAVQWAVAQGITSGTSTTTFSPDAACSRAQIVTFLYRQDSEK